jgi:hypothetical protein
VVGQLPVIPGAIIRSRPVGVLLMEDENGLDEKILTVPVDALYPFYSKIRSYLDLPDILCEQIAHFFKHYKDLEKGKWVKNLQWAGPEAARQAIVAAKTPTLRRPRQLAIAHGRADAPIRRRPTADQGCQKPFGKICHHRATDWARPVWWGKKLGCAGRFFASVLG